MAAVLTRNIVKKFGEVPAVNGITLESAGRRIHGVARPLGLRQDHVSAHHLRARKADERRPYDRRRHRQRYSAARPRRRDDVPELRPLSALLGAQQHRLSAADAARSPRRDRTRRSNGHRNCSASDHLLDRRPRQLSGGERQRVALARALVREPTALLLDEPLSNLDAKLRASARQEIKQFQQRVGVTTIYVTHDQVEAMGMGDRIAVIDHGRVRQLGTPAEIYDDPADRFVATFVGAPPMNLVARNGGYLGFRPENFLPKDMIDEAAVTEFSFRVDRSEYLGSERIVYGVIEGFDAKQVITAKFPPAHVAEESIRPGEWHSFAVRNSALRYFDKDGKRTSRR